jgi:hypothetical protein
LFDGEGRLLIGLCSFSFGRLTDRTLYRAVTLKDK